MDKTAALSLLSTLSTTSDEAEVLEALTVLGCDSIGKDGRTELNKTFFFATGYSNSATGASTDETLFAFGVTGINTSVVGASLAASGLDLSAGILRGEAWGFETHP
jgi:hypothetical protein